MIDHALGIARPTHERGQNRKYRLGRMCDEILLNFLFVRSNTEAVARAHEAYEIRVFHPNGNTQGVVNFGQPKWKAAARQYL